jgi:hypothetical protein
MLTFLLAQQSGFSTAVSLVGFWVCIAAMVVVPSLAYYWQQARKVDAETALKQQMVERGYSAEEILAVVNNSAKHLKGSTPKGGAMTPSKLPPEHSHV